jgi:hypothetical protein
VHKDDDDDAMINVAQIYEAKTKCEEMQLAEESCPGKPLMEGSLLVSVVSIDKSCCSSC